MLDTKAQLQELYSGGFLPHCRHLFPNLELVCDAWFCTDNFMVPQPYYTHCSTSIPIATLIPSMFNRACPAS
jgi:hypothetical protein